MDTAPETTEDRLLAGKIRLMQPRRGHRAGTDAVLLAAAASRFAAANVVDVGSASGAVGLMLALAKPESEVTFIEQDAWLADLCRRNGEANDLAARAHVIAGDIFDGEAMERCGVVSGAADLVVSNPPFLEAERARLSPDADRRKAHALPKDGLARWIVSCARLVGAKGTMVLIHRADRLPQCLAAIPPDFGACRIRMIHPRSDAEAVRVLLAATRGRRSPAIIEPPLILHEADGSFTAEAKAIHDGDWLPR